jgi:hypothetical protein
MVAYNPERNRDALAWGCHNLLQICRVFPAEHQLAVRKIEDRKKVVEERSLDDTVDLLRAKASESWQRVALRRERETAATNCGRRPRDHR